MNELEAGLDLDALIAEKVMGLITGPIVEIIGGKAVNAAGDSIILPDYSTDIAYAWQVVEKITEIPKEGIATNTIFAGWFDRAALWAMTAEEAAEAICLAALKTVGGKSPLITEDDQ